MDDLFLLSEAQMRRIEPFFPLSHGIPRVDDRRVISGIVFVIKNGLRWRDAPVAYGPHKTIYNRFIRWSRMGIFNRIFAELAGQAGEPAYYGRFGFKKETSVAAPYPLSVAYREGWQSVTLQEVLSPLRGAVSVPQPWCHPELWSD